MKFIPILFSTEMVQAERADRKTMTRRTRGLEAFNEYPDDWEYIRFYDGHAKFCVKNNHPNEKYVKCPYGQPGDVLWVRETFSKITSSSGFIYKADNDPYDEPIKWKPGIHMPKAACRTFLLITHIRPQRLQSITEEDALAEGVQPFIIEGQVIENAKTAFKHLWFRINDTQSWLIDPWVWVIGFSRIHKPSKFL